MWSITIWTDNIWEICLQSIERILILITPTYYVTTINSIIPKPKSKIQTKAIYFPANYQGCPNGTIETSPLLYSPQPCAPLATPTNTRLKIWLDPSQIPSNIDFPNNQGKLSVFKFSFKIFLRFFQTLEKVIEKKID